MAAPTLPIVQPNATLDELRDQVAILQKTITYYLSSGIGSSNIAEVGGWVIGDNDIVSSNGAMGLSSLVSPENDIRLWAGDANALIAPFRVHEDGSVYASNIHITGGTISWGDMGLPPQQPVDYDDLIGNKPPADADNTKASLVGTGLVWDAANQRYQIDYNNVNGLKPPPTADNTMNAIINRGFTYASDKFVYTNTLAADRILAGTLTGFTINTLNSSLNRRITMDGPRNEIASFSGEQRDGFQLDGATGSLIQWSANNKVGGIIKSSGGFGFETMQIYHNNGVALSHGAGGTVYLGIATTDRIKANGNWDFGSAKVTGLTAGAVAKFG